MTSEEALEIIEKMLPPGSLTPIKRLVFQQSWNGKEYAAIAKELGYDNSYIRDTGAQLWRSLSAALQEPISKKNFRALLQQKLVQESLQMQRETTIDRTQLSDEPEYPGRPVPLHSKFYIEHSDLEQKANSEISKQMGFLRIKSPPKTGKSSFLARIMHHATHLGYYTLSLNFKQIEAQFFSDLNQFLRWFCTTVSYQLELEPNIEPYWNRDISPTERCMLYFTRYLLPQINRPLVLAFNNFDEVLSYPQLAQDFLFMIQAWHEEATQRRSLQKLRLILIYSGDIDNSDLPKQFYLSDMGRSIHLPSFNSTQVQILAQRYQLQGMTSQMVQALIELTGGHPYLVQLALYHLWTQEVTLTQLLRSNSIPDLYQEHLQNCLSNLQAEPKLATVLKQLLESGSTDRLNSKSVKKLQNLGLIKQNNGEIKLSNMLYKTYFKRHL
jgi:hypothetical protein